MFCVCLFLEENFLCDREAWSCGCYPTIVLGVWHGALTGLIAHACKFGEVARIQMRSRRHGEKANSLLARHFGAGDASRQTVTELWLRRRRCELEEKRSTTYVRFVFCFSIL